MKPWSLAFTGLAALIVQPALAEVDGATDEGEAAFIEPLTPSQPTPKAKTARAQPEDPEIRRFWDEALEKRRAQEHRPLPFNESAQVTCLAASAALDEFLLNAERREVLIEEFFVLGKQVVEQREVCQLIDATGNIIEEPLPRATCDSAVQCDAGAEIITARSLDEDITTSPQFDLRIFDFDRCQ